MSWRRPLALSALWAATACDTGAVGVAECERIETARCRAATSCGMGLDDKDAQETCERFARDDCLHGLPLDEAPRRTDVDRCVAAITAAGTCNAQGTTLAKDCPTLGVASTSPSTACEVIQDPEQLGACEFLTGEPAAGGATSTGGASSTGGAASTGGAPSDAGPG